MNGLAGTIWRHAGGHPPDDDLYLFVDGELTDARLNAVSQHLAACWQCRVRVEEIETTISRFVKYRQQVFLPGAPPPPRQWRGFPPKLAESAAAEHASPVARLRELLGRVALAEPSRATVLATICLLLTGCVTALVWWLGRVPAVSAHEVLERAAAAETRALQATVEPVVYQRLRLRRSGGAEQSAQWESWHDPRRARVRRRWEGNAQALWQELEQLAQQHRLEPLSPQSYRAWLQTHAAQAEVARGVRQGQDVLILTHTLPQANGEGALTAAQLTVRARDWHPVEQRLRVNWQGAAREYELSETGYEIVSLNVLGAAFFEEKPELKMAVAALPSPLALLPSPSLSPAPTASLAPPSSTLTAAELGALEIEALHLLQQTGADLGEQIEVERAGTRVRIHGLVETEQRRAQLLAALAPLRRQPAVSIELRTIAEAAAAEQASSANQPAQITLREEGAASEPLLAAALREHFTRQGSADAEAQARRFAAQALAQTRQAMQRGYALRQLRARFAAPEFDELSADAQARLVTLAQTHARALQAPLQALRATLQPVFPALDAGGAANESLPNAAALAPALERLFTALTTLDQAVRASFAAAAGRGGAATVNTPAFWRAWQQARQLAEAIENF